MTQTRYKIIGDCIQCFKRWTHLIIKYKPENPKGVCPECDTSLVMNVEEVEV